MLKSVLCACGALFFFSFILRHYGKKAGGGALSWPERRLPKRTASVRQSCYTERGMDAAAESLDEAGVRQETIAKDLARAREALLQHKQKYVGTLGAPTVGRKQAEKKILGDISRLERGLLPGEYVPVEPRAPGALKASALQHAQRHAEPSRLPAGRPAQAEVSSASGGGDGGDGDGVCDEGAGESDDDDAEDPDFKQFYRVSLHQRRWNTQRLQEWLSKGASQASRKQTRIQPPNVLTNMCQPEHIGLGTLRTGASRYSHATCCLALPCLTPWRLASRLALSLSSLLF